MIITLSERRLSELIRGLEGIQDTDEEIAFQMQRHAIRLFRHVAEDYRIRMVGLVEHSGGIGSFKFDISGIGKNWQTGGFDFEKLTAGLSFINPLCVSLEEQDIEHICDGPVATAMMDHWEEYAGTLQRITVSEIQPAIEKACLEFAWKPPSRNRVDRQPGARLRTSIRRGHRPVVAGRIKRPAPEASRGSRTSAATG